MDLAGLAIAQHLRVPDFPLRAKKFQKLSKKRKIYYINQWLGELPSRFCLLIKETQEAAALTSASIAWPEFALCYLAFLGEEEAAGGASACWHSEYQREWQQLCTKLWSLAQGEISAHDASARENSVLAAHCSALQHLHLQFCSSDLADWDFKPASSLKDLPMLEAPAPVILYLDRIRSPFNVGSLFRTGVALGAAGLLLHPQCPSPSHLRCVRSAMGCVDLLPWAYCDLQAQLLGKANLVQGTEFKRGSEGGLGVPSSADLFGKISLGKLPLVALEMGGCSLADYAFPNSGGLLLLGSEEEGLSPDLLELCAEEENLKRGGGRVSIATRAAKSSLNVGVAAGIALQRWTEALGT